MDPITAVGLASAIVTFVNVGTEIVKRVKELSEAGDVPEVFRDIKSRLPLIISIVVRTQRENERLAPEAKEAFEEIVRQCFEQVRQLEGILNRVTISRGDSRLTKTFRAGISLVEEGRVQRIATGLRDNVQLLKFLNVTPVEKKGEEENERPRPRRLMSEALPSYASITGTFSVPFSRDEHFIGRDKDLQAIASSFTTNNRVAICGIGGVDKSQIPIEYCYRHKESNAGAHVLWVYGGTIARFYQGYKRIAQLLEIPGWDDPEESILELVSSWLSTTRSPYLLVIDNADNIEHWWPGKYKSGGSLDDPSKHLSKFLPDGVSNGHTLITTRDSRVASRLAREAKPIALEPMSNEEAKSLFLSKLGGEQTDHNELDVQNLLEELDHLPLAVSQAAAFIEQNGISIADYTKALEGEEAKEFLDEELDDCRRDEESDNSVFRTWKLSYDQIKRQKPRAAELLSIIAMLDRQSVPRFLLKVPEVTTSLTVLQSFNLVTIRAGSQSYQIHRLVQRFVQHSNRGEGTLQKWRETALTCVSKEYPIAIGVAEWPVCDSLAPHVHVLTGYGYEATEARLDLAHLLCWAADFDIERGMYAQALERANQSLQIFRQLCPERDQRLAAATWLYGRLRCYQAHSPSDLVTAAELLEQALSISDYPSLNYAETAFELAHLYYDQCNDAKCLEMGKASFECWEALEGATSSRVLDNMHDYALGLAMLGHEEEGIAKWQEIVDRAPASDASRKTQTIYTLRSMAAIAEFQDDAAVAEDFYTELIKLGESMYDSEHIHVYDYRLSHAEQIMRQRKFDEAMRLSEAMLATCQNHSEWRISASGLQTIAECCRLKADHGTELTYRLRTFDLHNEKLGRNHKETVDAEAALADCYLCSGSYFEAEAAYQRVLS